MTIEEKLKEIENEEDMGVALNSIEPLIKALRFAIQQRNDVLAAIVSEEKQKRWQEAGDAEILAALEEK